MEDWTSFKYKGRNVEVELGNWFWVESSNPYVLEERKRKYVGGAVGRAATALTIVDTEFQKTVVLCCQGSGRPAKEKVYTV